MGKGFHAPLGMDGVWTYPLPLALKSLVLMRFESYFHTVECIEESK